MADQDGDKTEAATPRRRQEAREQGNIARSPDVTSAALLLAVLMLLSATGPKLVGALRALVAQMLGGSSLNDLDGNRALDSFSRALGQIGWALAPLLAGVFVVAVVANVVQVGLNFSPQRLQPNLAALNPLKGWGKLFGGGLKPVQMLLNVAKLFVLIGVAYSAIHSRLSTIVLAQQLSFTQIFLLGAQMFYSIALRMALTLFIIAIVEYLYQRYRIEQELKMTKQEVKEEMRRMEGDPKVKQRRRQIALQNHQRKLKKDVPTADVVVTNPTEFAIALKYDTTTMHAPTVVAKGQGFIAAKIREIAIENGIPILERKPLARALYKMVEVGQEIPEQFYAAVAEILAYVYELSGKMRKKAG
jgi:flagellar biosynthetic protein FlhB